MRILRQALPVAKEILLDEGYLTIESKPRAGLTCFLAQIGHEFATLGAGSVLYINAAFAKGALTSEIAEKLGGQRGEHDPRALVRGLVAQAPLILLLDDVHAESPEGREELRSLIKLFAAERMFMPGLRQVYLVFGATGNGSGARIKLDYFSPSEVAILIGRPPQDSLALALYAWTRGVPEIARELARDLICRDARPHDVYTVVKASAECGALRSMVGAGLAHRDPPHDGWRLDFSVPALTLAVKLAESRRGGLVINRDRMEVRFSGKLVPLFPQEMRILMLLAGKAGRVFSAAQIYAELNGGRELYLGESSIKAQISRLRSKLPVGHAWINTRRGLGYVFNPQSDYTYIR